MTRRTDQLSLGAFPYPTGHHIAAWRHPQAQADAGSNFAHYAELARIAEAAKFDRSLWPMVSVRAERTPKRSAARLSVTSRSSNR